jgi:Sigma-70 region 2
MQSGVTARATERSLFHGQQSMTLQSHGPTFHRNEPFLAISDLQHEAVRTYVTETSRSEARAKKEDELLVIRCQLGERSAFNELIERWHQPIWRYLRRLAGDDAVQDVAQDVWLRVLRGIGRLRDGSKLRPWLFGIARRALMDRLRNQYASQVDSDIDVTELAVDPGQLSLCGY